MIKLLNSIPTSLNDTFFYLTGKHKEIKSIGKLKMLLINMGFSPDVITFTDISDICMLDKNKGIILCQHEVQTRSRIFFIEVPQYMAFMFKSRYYSEQKNLYNEIKSMYDSCADDMIDILYWYRDVLEINLTEEQVINLLIYANQHPTTKVVGLQ